METLIAHLPTVGALLAGVIVHIVKKAAQRRQENSQFNLKDYLLGHPYQTLSMFGTAIGAYFGLMNLDGGLTLQAAFLAGIAANSMSDVAKGSR